MARERSYQVKDVAEIAGISVRTLHHYDEIGLLVPSARSDSGYRLYSDDDLLRLQQIMVDRELGLPLEEIRGLLDDPGFDRRQALVAQRAELTKRARQTDAMLRAVDAALARLDAADGVEKEKGETMDDAALFGEPPMHLVSARIEPAIDAQPVPPSRRRSIPRRSRPCTPASRRTIRRRWTPPSGLTPFLAEAIRQNARRHGR